MKYYISKHELINLKKGDDFAALLHRDKSETARYAIDIALISNCHACSVEFVSEEGNQHDRGDFCDFCLNIHGD